MFYFLKTFYLNWSKMSTKNSLLNAEPRLLLKLLCVKKAWRQSLYIKLLLKCVLFLAALSFTHIAWNSFPQLPQYFTVSLVFLPHARLQVPQMNYNFKVRTINASPKITVGIKTEITGNRKRHVYLRSAERCNRMSYQLQ